MSPRLDVDLAAFETNLDALRTRVAPAQLMLVVKDDAYGHGIARTVPRAVAGGTRWIGAFDVPTARGVRDAVGPDVRVFVWMLPTPGDVADAVALDLDLGVGDASLLEDVARAAGEDPVRVHLKIDTGLHRNGFRPEEWDDAVRRARVLEERGVLRVVGVWSHIAEASDAADDDARAVFEWALDRARDAGLDPQLRHLSASSAAYLRPEFRYDLVRIGAFAYGVAPAGGPTSHDLALTPIGRLAAEVTDVGDVVRIGVGALHGLPSTLAGRITVTTPDGPRTVRRIGLTASAVDAWPRARIGDELIVWGVDEGQTATDLAERIGTIGEEIVTRLSPRVERRSTAGG